MKSCNTMRPWRVRGYSQSRGGTRETFSEARLRHELRAQYFAEPGARRGKYAAEEELLLEYRRLWWDSLARLAGCPSYGVVKATKQQSRSVHYEAVGKLRQKYEANSIASSGATSGICRWLPPLPAREFASIDVRDSVRTGRDLVKPPESARDSSTRNRRRSDTGLNHP